MLYSLDPTWISGHYLLISLMKGGGRKGVAGVVAECKDEPRCETNGIEALWAVGGQRPGIRIQVRNALNGHNAKILSDDLFLHLPSQGISSELK